MVRRSNRVKAKANAVPVRGGWDVLPHNMGAQTSATSTSTPLPAQATVSATITALPSEQPVTSANASVVSNPKIVIRLGNISGQESSEPEINGRDSESSTLPHNTAEVEQGEADISESAVKVKKEDPEGVKQDAKDETTGQGEVTTLRRSKRNRTQVNDEDYSPGNEAPPKRARQARKQAKEDIPKKPKRVPLKTKDNPYGLTPGRSPFPEWEAPSAAQCEEVYRILADMHDDVQPQSPEVIPAPSLEVTGCGEVPYVLEALMRTLLSGAVTFAGAAKMLKGIIERYGVLEEGLAKGSVDWNKVRLSSFEDLVEAIRAGGLSSVKAKCIKDTLDMVHQENLERRQAYLAEKETGIPADVYGASGKTQGQKDLEILKTEQNVLSLDHMRGLSADEAMRQFTKFPGIGVKTAACVILFCLQMPCFAVDTHVHRFSKWLGWAPPKADENRVFSHLEVRCPDHLKYGLHQLFIRHGQTCARCKTSTAEGTKEWEASVCPLEHLLVRSKKMAKPKPKKARKGKVAEGKDDIDEDKVKSESEELEESELSDIDETLFMNNEFLTDESQNEDVVA